jgi:hypothetical protein
MVYLFLLPTTTINSHKFTRAEFIIAFLRPQQLDPSLVGRSCDTNYSCEIPFLGFTTIVDVSTSRPNETSKVSSLVNVFVLYLTNNEIEV